MSFALILIPIAPVPHLAQLANKDVHLQLKVGLLLRTLLDPREQLQSVNTIYSDICSLQKLLRTRISNTMISHPSANVILGAQTSGKRWVGRSGENRQVPLMLLSKMIS